MDNYQAQWSLLPFAPTHKRSSSKEYSRGERRRTSGSHLEEAKEVDKARLHSVNKPEAGAWLKTIPRPDMRELSIPAPASCHAVRMRWAYLRPTFQWDCPAHSVDKP